MIQAMKCKISQKIETRLKKDFLTYHVFLHKTIK